MKNVWRIFKRDLMALITRFFPLAIILGVLVLPSLYAWFNIFSNWDPYANTSNIHIAVFSEDVGYTDEDGEYTNVGESVVDGLRDNTAIGWVFCDSTEEAVAGVYSGDYYAAIIIDENFSDDMYSVFDQDFENPVITYYENEKKNAVATKITDTAVSTVQQNVNRQFIAVIVSTIMESTNEISEDLENSTVMDDVLGKLYSMRDHIEEYQRILDSLDAAQSALDQDIADVQKGINQAMSEVNQQRQNNANNKQTFVDAEDDINDAVSDLNAKVAEISNQVDTLYQNLPNYSDEEIQNQINGIITDTDSVQNAINEAKKKLEEDQGYQDKKDQATKDYEDALNNLGTSSGELKKSAEEAKGTASTAVRNSDALKNSVAKMKDVSDKMNNFAMDDFMKSIEDVFDSIDSFLEQMNVSLRDANKVMQASGNTATSASLTMKATGTALRIIANRLDSIIDTVEAIQANGASDIIMSLLRGDPESFGEFFSEPVLVETEAVYPVENYGSAVAPFYTTLAIWVGCTILVSIIKVGVPPKYHEGASPTELFFGRYLLFLFLSELQTTIIVIGNIFLVGAQVMHPIMFWLTATLTSFTFSVFIYALTLVFGDFGKAIAVIIMVVQIAGSGGTYPIEILPDFYRHVYIFFPFPYAINAMRETIAGMYKWDYFIYLCQLLVFAAAGLGIGLFLRMPFYKLTHYIEERMEDTEMM